MKENYQKIFIIIILVGLSTLGVLAIPKTPRKKSVIESRKLSNLEDIHSKDILKGQIDEKFEKALSDQFYKRDDIIEIYSKLQFLIGKRFINNVFIAKNNILIQKQKKLNQELLSDNFFKLNDLQKELSHEKIDMLYVSLLSKTDAMENLLPLHMRSGTSKDSCPFLRMNKNNFDSIDLTKKYIGRSDYYYKTDHHWNTDGTFVTYERIIKEINKKYFFVGNPKEKESFDSKIYKNIFIGSLGRKITRANLTTYDDLEVLRPLKNFDVIYETEKGIEPLFNMKAIDPSPKSYNNDYMVFLNGDRTGRVKNLKPLSSKKLFLISDSFGNSLVPLLAPHFKEILDIDPRKFNGSISEEIKKEKPDIVIFVYKSDAPYNTSLFNF